MILEKNSCQSFMNYEKGFKVCPQIKLSVLRSALSEELMIDTISNKSTEPEPWFYYCMLANIEKT